MSKSAPAARVVVITGASSGLGAELARLYAAPGLTLGLIGRDASRLQATGIACEAKGAQVECVQLDVRRSELMAEWLIAFDAAHPVDILIASAGVSAGVADAKTPEGVALAALQVEVNLLGAMHTVEPLAPLMVGRGRGQIVVVSSIAGLRGLPYSPGYSASKAGVRAYGEALRTLLGPTGVAVTVVCPGFFASPMTDRWQGDTPFLWPVEQTAKAVMRAVSHRRARWGFPWPLILGLRLADLGPTWITDPIMRGFHFRIERP